MAVLIKGKDLSAKIVEKIRQEVINYDKKPTLVVIIVGNNPASQVYVSKKKHTSELAGFNSRVIELEESISQQDLEKQIEILNQDKNVNGILVQLPLPKHINTYDIIEKILPEKDVDGLHPINIGRFMNNKYLSDTTILLPCTPYGVIRLLQAYNIPIAGKDVVVIGRSNLVGKPLGMLFLAENATVTFCHSKTQNLKTATQRADIAVSAVGKPKFIDETYIKKGAIVIDVGFNYADKLLVGDVDFEAVAPIASAITPVPGGVGPMTVAILMENVWKAYQRQTSTT